jgi:hypothetical protein
MTAPDDLVDITELSSRRGRLSVNYHLGTWIPCPPMFPAGYDRAKWALTFADGFSRRPGLDPSAQEIKDLAATLTRIHEYTYGNVACHMGYIHQPHPTLFPLPVYMATWQATGDRDEAMRRLANADAPDVIQPPSVAEFTARHLGAGLKALRFGRQPGKQREDDQVYAALNYAWRDEELETDLRVFAATTDIGRLQLAMADIDELVNVTRLVVAPPL